MAHYLALIHQEGDSSYGVSFPDFPGCISGGDTLDEARVNAVEGLAFHVEGMRENGELIPAPSSLDEVVSHPDYEEAKAVIFVELAEPADRVVRVNISAPERALDRIDRAAHEAGQTRSAFLIAAGTARADELLGR